MHAPPSPACGRRWRARAMTAMLSITDLDVRYGAIQAVRGVSLDVAEGEIVALLGANGAGKTTTLKAAVGLVATTRGEIRFAGKPITGRDTEDIVIAGMTLVPEGRRVFPSLTVTENLRLGAATRRNAAEIEQSRNEVLALFPILAERA